MKARLYKTYRFVNKDPVIDRVRTIIADEKKSYDEIAAKSGVSAGTLRNWFHGATRRPQHATLMAVVRSMGYDYRLVKMGVRVVARTNAGKPQEERRPSA